MRRAGEEGLRAIAFVGGGTGGHIFPGVALAERARERFPGCRTLFLRTLRSVEEKVFAGRGLETRAVDIQAPGGTALGWLRYSMKAAAARSQIRSILRDGVDVVFGLGGYASLPGLLAARAEGIPIVLLEQNRVAGRVNRLLAPLADAIACPFPGARVRFASRIAVTGNPLRREVLEAAALRAAREGGPGTRRTVLVAGGSQGSSGINRAIREALPRLVEFREKINWIHMAGDADKDAVTEAYRTHGFGAEVFAFSSRFPALMARSDLVLGRSGGTTVSEIAALGLPSVLIPYPHHRDQHQRRNAEVLEQAGAAVILDEGRLDADSLREVFRDVLFAGGRLEAMGRSARALSRPDASDAILDLSLDLKRPRGIERQCPPASVSSS